MMPWARRRARIVSCAGSRGHRHRRACQHIPAHTSPPNLRGMSSPGLSLLTLNIGNPSPDRAQRQLAWLVRREEDVLVLTETKASAGCRLLAEEFTAAGYAVHYSAARSRRVRHDDRQHRARGAGRRVRRPDRLPAVPGRSGDPARAGRAAAGHRPVRALRATPAPSKTERKRKWLAACDAALASATTGMPAIVLGDLNILEPGPLAPLPVLRPVRVRLLPALAEAHRLTDVFRAPAPGRSRIQLGRPDRRRLPV